MTSTESTWPAISHANIEGTYCALEAARRFEVSPASAARWHGT